MRVPTEQRVTEWLRAHLQNLLAWTDPAAGRIYDPFESHQHDAHIPAESYSPATALAIAARAARMGSGESGALLAGYCRRTAQLLADESTGAFTALFLQFFGLCAGEDLRAVAAQENPPIAPGDVEAFLSQLVAYRDRLDTPINTNCAAMQAGVEMLKQLLAGRADWARCRDRLAVVARQQTRSGFINDDLSGMSAPVAYHMFCLYLLAAAWCRAGRGQMPPEAYEPLQQADKIIAGGYGWLGHLLGNDGMIAQHGRSRYHPFALAETVAMLAAAGIEAEDAVVRRLIAWMDQHRMPADEANGLAAAIFPVTPNLCPQALRVGFETYGMVAVYNNLAMHILLDALAWWRTLLPTIGSAAEARKALFNTAREPGAYCDPEAGLARLRSRAGYTLIVLQPDARGYAPAGSLVHLRLGDDLHERAIAPPFWADPRVLADAPERSVWEGPLLCDAGSHECTTLGPSRLLTESELLESKAAATAFMLHCNSPEGRWSKSIVLDPAMLVLQYRVQPAAAGRQLIAVVPVLLWDGLNQAQLRFADGHVDCTWAGLTWRMTILDAQGRPLPGAWFLSPYRSTLSTSGVTGRLQFPVHRAAPADEPITWAIQVEAM